VNTYIKNSLSALGDPTRLAVFDMLGAHPRAVHELAAGLPVSRPAVSQHLRVLKQARLMRDRRDGARRIYELNPEGIALLRDHFAHLWGQALTAFQKFAEEEYRKEKRHITRSSTNGSSKTDHPRKRIH
jgi:DNA-binding transcriptional ArsR family regulator